MFSADVHAQSRSNAYQVERFSVRGEPLIEAHLSGGSIEFEGRESDEVEVLIFIREGGRYQKKGDLDKEPNLDVVQNGDKIIVKGGPSNSRGWFGWWGSDQNLHIRILGPEKSSVNFSTSGGELDVTNLHSIAILKTSGGQIDLENVSGKFEFQTSGGSIDIEQASGIFEGRTSGGSIDVSGAEGTFNLRTSGGSIDVEQGRGDFTLKTSAGNIDMEEMSGSLSATTSAGNIDLSVLELTGDVNLKTSAGSIDITLPASAEFYYRLKGFDTEVRHSDFSAENVRIIKDNRQLMNNTIEGEVGSAAFRVIAVTSAGSVRINS